VCGPVLAGVVENVVEARAWYRWDEWRDAFRQLGYRTRLIAFNSMHADAPCRCGRRSPGTGCTPLLAQVAAA
jgi:DNA (cytosine-5)-methyltransferase 1